ncbi:MAG: MotA/TolQ/ExbB proton channel family protein [Bacteroidota bacterium]
MFPNLFLFFQDVTLDGGEAGEATYESQSLLDIVASSGLLGIAIVAILGFLLLLALYIFFERYATIRQAAKVDQTFMANIRSYVSAGNITGARTLCQQTDMPVARMVEKGLQRIGKPLSDIDAAIENVGNLEIFRLEKGLSTLASISGAAPMIGFFGTVTGMINAFYEMSTADNITPDVLAGGIYQALITTAAGLLIGILSFIGYNLLVARVERAVYLMERTTTEFMDLLQEPTA